MFTSYMWLILAFGLASLIAVVSTVIFLGSLRFPKAVFVYANGQHQWLDSTDTRAIVTVCEMKRARRMLRYVLGPVALVLGAFAVWFVMSGALADANRGQAEVREAKATATAELVVAASAAQFIEPLAGV